MTTRVGLLTLPLHKNYGGILQAAALYEHMRALGFHVVFLQRVRRQSHVHAIGYEIIRISSRLSTVSGGEGPIVSFAAALLSKHRSLAGLSHKLKRLASHYRFISRFLPVRSGLLSSADDMRSAIDSLMLDAIVVGSDQVWRPDYIPDGAVSDFFLGFAQGTSVRRISYAASFGHGEWRYPDQTAVVTKLLAEFSTVSVREASGVQICRDVFGRTDAVHVLDPTLLVDPALYDRVADEPTAKKGNVLFEYILDHEGSTPTIGEDVAASLWNNCSVRSVALDAESSLLGVGGWVRAIMDADFVMTDSFHGMVFSIIFRKNFLAVVNHKRGADRFISLARLLGLEDRLIDGRSREQACALAAQPIDYAAVTPRLEAMRAHSRAFLSAALGGASFMAEPS